MSDERLLVCDDDRQITRALRLVLSEAGYDVVICATGEEALDRAAIKVDALQTGADDYVTKPFGPGELVARVGALLRRAGRVTAEPVIESDGLVIDLAGHRVTVAGEETHLTPIEFSLLRALATNRGLLMTHETLLVEVWVPSTATRCRCCGRTSRTCAASLLLPGGVRTSSVLTRAWVTASSGEFHIGLRSRRNLDEILIHLAVFFMRA
jgi:DNA-binding response OmpR family regulator